MEKILYIDIETYSSADIKTCGAYKYVESLDFEILLIGYAIDDSPVKVVDLASGESMPEELEHALRNHACLKVAHNAVFERLCFKQVGYDIPIEEWYCTSVKAAYCGLPLSLDGVSKALKLSKQKLSIGSALIKYFSCPCKPTKINGGRHRNLPHHAPEKWEMYKKYNMYDVLAEREIYERLEEHVIPRSERLLYALDQRINDRGILIDTELAKSAIAVDEQYSRLLLDRAKEITGLDNPNSVAQLKRWIEVQTGYTVESLSKEAVADLESHLSDYPHVLELLSIRKRLAKTSIKKYYAMLNCAMDDKRARGTFQFYGANRTGRWAGRLIQLQNLSKNKVSPIELPRELIRARDWDSVELLYGDVSDILSQLVRTALIASPGKVLSVADFSAIEARVISWLANEQWRMEVFKGDGKIYEATGSKMFGVPISAITKGSALRDKSKISELALGYEGSVGALKRMGGEKMGLSDAEMSGLVQRWRAANPSIVALWGVLDKAAKEAVRYQRHVVCTCRNLVFDCDGSFLTIQLPSGRKLYYYHPHFRDKQINSSAPMRSLCYEGVSQETKQWCSIDTYGGKLTENIVQAIARDLLAHSMMELDKRGYHPICHIHDEVIVEVPMESAKEDYEKMAAIMGEAPSWASDLPLRADGYITPFYLKD